MHGSFRESGTVEKLILQLTQADFKNLVKNGRCNYNSNEMEENKKNSNFLCVPLG